MQVTNHSKIKGPLATHTASSQTGETGDIISNAFLPIINASLFKTNKPFLLRSIYKINSFLKTSFAYANKIDPAIDFSYKTPELLLFSTRIHLVSN